VERFCDFFLSQLHKEGIDSNENSQDDESWVSKHFGCHIVSHMRCEGCLSTKEQPSNTTSFDMKYDQAAPGTSFHEILVQTLSKSRRFRMQCSECKRSNLFKSSSVLTLIPPALVFKCDLSGPDGEVAPRLQLWRSSPNWLKSKFSLQVDKENQTIKVSDSVDNDDDQSTYILTAVVARITDQRKKSARKDHFVAIVRVSPGYLEQHAPTEAAGEDNEKSSSQWYIFNDFRVTVTSEQEALNFTSTWKTPCILVYAKPETANCDTLMAAPELKNVLIWCCTKHLECQSAAIAIHSALRQ